jgi:integron integrase
VQLGLFSKKGCYTMRLKDQFFTVIKFLGRKRKTGETYWSKCQDYFRWLRDYHGVSGQWIHPKECGSAEIEKWLSWMASTRHVAPKTQNQALQSVLFLYKRVLKIDIQDVDAMRSKEHRITIKDVLSPDEVSAVIGKMKGVNRLMIQLLYAGAMRRSDVCQLRIKELHFATNQIALKETKHGHQHWTLFPESLHAPVRGQINAMRRLNLRDQDSNPMGVSLPHAFRRKSPKACLELPWYYLFCSNNLSRCPETGVVARHHRDSGHVNRSLKEAAQRAGVLKRVTSHILRHSSATHLHQSGVPMRDLQQLLGHTDIRTTEGYVHSDQSVTLRMISPIDRLPKAG